MKNYKKINNAFEKQFDFEATTSTYDFAVEKTIVQNNSMSNIQVSMVFWRFLEH